mgnify:CR=1 FL=1|tara:strand:+ start:247 stop:993 length:747 start_codon:yes stop_codon:yes gene_type:complete
MSLTITDKGGNDDFSKLEKGMYEGALYSIVDIGSKDYQFGNEDPKKQHKVVLSFEVTKALDPEDNKVTMEDGRPFGISKVYTMSLHEKAALRLDIESWRGKSLNDEELAGFDLLGLLGHTVKVEIDLTQKTTINGKAYEGGNPKIAALREPAGGTRKIATKNEQRAFDLEVYCDEFKGNSSPETKAMCDVHDELPQWQQDEIAESFELKAAKDSDQETRPASTAVATDNLETISEEGSQGLKDDEIPF